MSEEENHNYDFITMLEEAQLQFNAQLRSFDVLRDHAKTILGIASILVPVFSAFVAIAESHKSIAYYFILVITGILYALLIIASFHSFSLN